MNGTIIICVGLRIVQISPILLKAVKKGQKGGFFPTLMVLSKSAIFPSLFLLDLFYTAPKNKQKTFYFSSPTQFGSKLPQSRPASSKALHAHVVKKRDVQKKDREKRKKKNGGLIVKNPEASVVRWWACARSQCCVRHSAMPSSTRKRRHCRSTEWSVVLEEIIEFLFSFAFFTLCPAHIPQSTLSHVSPLQRTETHLRYHPTEGRC